MGSEVLAIPVALLALPVIFNTAAALIFARFLGGAGDQSEASLPNDNIQAAGNVPSNSGATPLADPGVKP